MDVGFQASSKPLCSEAPEHPGPRPGVFSACSFGRLPQSLPLFPAKQGKVAQAHPLWLFWLKFLQSTCRKDSEPPTDPTNLPSLPPALLPCQPPSPMSQNGAAGAEASPGAPSPAPGGDVSLAFSSAGLPAWAQLSGGTRSPNLRFSCFILISGR